MDIHRLIVSSVAIAATVTYAQAQAKRPLTPADEQLIKQMVRDDAGEIELGTYVAEKTSNPKVRAFAKMIADDHKAAGEKVLKLALDKDVTVHDVPTEEQSRLESQLQKLSGRELDETYLAAMVKDHKDAIAKVKETASTTQDAQVRQLASTTLPVLEKHLHQAEELATDGKPAGAVER
jgi:putative membrane protein